jgi:hypothetical protein
MKAVLVLAVLSKTGYANSNSAHSKDAAIWKIDCHAHCGSVRKIA